MNRTLILVAFTIFLLSGVAKGERFFFHPQFTFTQGKLPEKVVVKEETYTEARTRAIKEQKDLMVHVNQFLTASDRKDTKAVHVAVDGPFYGIMGPKVLTCKYENGTVWWPVENPIQSVIPMRSFSAGSCGPGG